MLTTRLRRQLLQTLLRKMGIRRRRILAWRAMMVADVRSITFERGGFVWNVSHADDIGFALFVEDGYHAGEIRALAEWMRRHRVLSDTRRVFVDVGANIGTTCVPMVREAQCEALAIEPVGATFSSLKTNVELNGLADRILLARSAVLRAPGRVKICRMPASGGSFVWQQDLVDLPADMIGIEEVAGDGLAAIIESSGVRHDQVALVWADVQGCEGDVIESGAPLWRLGVPLWAEVEPHSLQRQGALASFPALAAAHFDRCIPSRDLLRHPEPAAIPISELSALIRTIPPGHVNIDVLFLPGSFPREPA
jgi:FkbM family methyltransferase